MPSADCAEFGAALEGKALGYRYADLARWLQRAGFQKPKKGVGSHRVWRHPDDGKKVTIVDKGTRHVLPAYVKETAQVLWTRGGCE